MTQQPRQPDLGLEEEEQFRPAAVRELFDEDGDMSMKTELSPRMVIQQLRSKMIQEYVNPRRTCPMLQVRDEAYRKLMVSFKRRGRLELLAASQAVAGATEEEIADL